MSGNSNSGRKPKYLQIKQWEKFLTNDWRHLNWKVNGLIALMSLGVAFIVAIFALALRLLFKLP